MRTMLLGILLLAVPALSQAQGYRGARDRSGTWEFSIAGIYQDKESAGGTAGSRVTVDSAWGLGFAVNYNFSNRLALGGEFEWLEPDYEAVLASDDTPGSEVRIDHRFTQFNTRFKGTYTLMDGAFSPYVEAGFGWSYFDSNVLDGPPITGCWWHPVWGYVCNNYYSTFHETMFGYGGALGLRYRIAGGTLLKLNYNGYWLDGGRGAADPTINAWRLEVGWEF